MYNFATIVDQFVSTHDKPDKRKFAQDMYDKIVRYLTNSLFAESNNYIPIRIKSLPNSGTPTSTSKSVS